MYVCMYVCMYMADVIRFNMNMLGSVTVSDLDAFIGQLRNVVYLCMYVCLYVCMYVCMYITHLHALGVGFYYPRCWLVWSVSTAAAHDSQDIQW